MDAPPDRGRCVGCGAALGADDELCASCGLPVGGSDELDRDVLARGLHEDPIREGAYRSHRQNRTVAIVNFASAALVAALAALAVWFLVAQETPASAAGWLAVLVGLALALALAVAAVVFGRGMLHAAVHLGAEGIVVVGAWPGQRRAIAWSEIRRFDVGVVYRALANPMFAVVVVLRSGERVRVYGITGETWLSRRRQRAHAALYAAALNRRLFAAGGTVGARVA